MSTDSKATLHYIYDPFCGWCYGLAPLLTEAARLDDLDVVAHSGGMLANERAIKMSKDWREFVRPHEVRITALSGQIFGPEYQEKTQFNYDIELDSTPPTAAMLAAETTSKDGIKMLKRLQAAYYKEGRPISDRAEIFKLAAEIGLDEKRFAEEYQRALESVNQHFDKTNELLSKVGGDGYPTLLLERDGQIERFHLAQFLGKPDHFHEVLRERLGMAAV